MHFEAPELVNIGNQMCDWIHMLSPAELENITEVAREPMNLMIVGNLQTATTR